MRRPSDDPAKAHRTRLLGFEWVGHVVLLELARPPAGHIEEAVVERETDVGYQRGDRLEAFQDGRQLIRVGGLAGPSITFSACHLPESRSQRQTEPGMPVRDRSTQ